MSNKPQLRNVMVTITDKKVIFNLKKYLFWGVRGMCEEEK